MIDAVGQVVKQGDIILFAQSHRSSAGNLEPSIFLEDVSKRWTKYKHLRLRSMYMDEQFSPRITTISAQFIKITYDQYMNFLLKVSYAQDKPDRRINLRRYNQARDYLTSKGYEV